MRTYILATMLSATLCIYAQVYTKNLHKWSIPSGNYSGITYLGDNRYAVVSDDETVASFHLWDINIDSIEGSITDVHDLGLRSSELKGRRDQEGIAFCAERGTIFISGEADQRILEHNMDGSLTGHELHVPEKYRKEQIQTNRGFEALCYDAVNHLFWTMTESALKEDPVDKLHLTYFGTDMRWNGETDYILSDGNAKNKGRDYYRGVAAIASLDDGRLLVLERETRIAKHYSGSKCWVNLFCFNPASKEKKLLKKWQTRFTVFNTRFANYEGMCLGPKLRDGRQTLILISDSQNGFGKGPWHLKDWIKVLIL